jgi:hypothetical protein
VEQANPDIVFIIGEDFDSLEPADIVDYLDVEIHNTAVTTIAGNLQGRVVDKFYTTRVRFNHVDVISTYPVPEVLFSDHIFLHS